MHYRAIFLSDLHLGSRRSKAARLVKFLSDKTADVLFLVGDIVHEDNEAPAAVIAALQAVSPTVVYCFGNHDVLGVIGDWRSVDHAFYTTLDGRRLLVMHGDLFDPLMRGWKVVMSGMPWSMVGTWFYRKFVQRARRCAIGLGADGIVCGHVHHAELNERRGFVYINCGDWVTLCTAAVEHTDGRFEILHAD